VSSTLVALSGWVSSGVFLVFWFHNFKLKLETIPVKNWQPCSIKCIGLMDYREAQEIWRALHRHEESIQCNRTSIFSITSKFHENEHHCLTQNPIIMNTLAQQKQQIDSSEAMCNMLRNLVLKLIKISQSTTSNHKISTNIIHQMLEDMDIGNQESHSTYLGLEEENSHHIFS
jgi:hypothetical protein